MTIQSQIQHYAQQLANVRNELQQQRTAVARGEQHEQQLIGAITALQNLQMQQDQEEALERARQAEESEEFEEAVAS